MAVCHRAADDCHIMSLALEGQRRHGADERKIEAMAKDAMKSGNIAVNPRKTTEEDIIKLYKAAF